MGGINEESSESALRRRRTVWLTAAGALSLLLPLLGALYLKVREANAPSGLQGRADVFEKREAGQAKIVASQAVSLPPPGRSMTMPLPKAASGYSGTAPVPASPSKGAPGGSSLDFVRSNAEYFKDGKTTLETPQVSAPAAKQTPSEEAAPAPSSTKAKTKAGGKAGKKPFAMPKLAPTRGFTQLKGAKGGDAAAEDAPAGGGQDMSEMLKNLPPGAEKDPEIQKLLKKRR